MPTSKPFSHRLATGIKPPIGHHEREGVARGAGSRTDDVAVVIALTTGVMTLEFMYRLPRLLY
jgi:hypothetical protein